MPTIKVFLLAMLSVASAFRGPSTLRPAHAMRSATPVCEEAAPSMAETATAAIDQLLGLLSDEAEPPKSLLPLKNAISEGDEAAISVALYSVMVEQALDYDMNDGLLYVRPLVWLEPIY